MPMTLPVQVLLGRTDGAVPVDVAGDLLAQVGEGGGLCAVGQHTRRLQRVDPHLPVLTAHHRHGAFDFVLRRRLQNGLLYHLVVGVEAAHVDRLADWLQRRAEDFTGSRMRASRCSEAVDNQVNLTQISSDDIDRLRLISSEPSPLILAAYRPWAVADWWKAAVLYQPGDRACPRCRALEEDTERIGTACECSGDPGCKSVSSRCPITKTFLGPWLMAPFALTYSICCLTFAPQPTG
jgi:hypothetical protein